MTDVSPTPEATLLKAREIGLEEGLHFVYVGNVPGDEYQHTICPGCGGMLIRRSGYRVTADHIRDGHCPYCDETISGIWMSRILDISQS